MHQRLNDEALEKYYQAVFAMHATPGWAALMEDVAEIRGIVNNVATCESPEELHNRRGQLMQLEWLLGHKEMFEKAYMALLAEQEGGEEGDVTGGIATVLE